MRAARVLVIGYGNPGRFDDGLGPALAAELLQRRLPHVTIESSYQLQVEDAEAIRHHDVVVFVDAAATGPDPFSVAEVRPGADTSFCTHRASPEQVLGWSHRLFGAKTRGFVVGVRGYRFDGLGERISNRAASNLRHAIAWLGGVLTRGDLAELQRQAAQSGDASRSPAGARAPALRPKAIWE